MSQTVPSVATVETSSTKPAQSALEETLRLIKSADSQLAELAKSTHVQLIRRR